MSNPDLPAPNDPRESHTDEPLPAASSADQIDTTNTPSTPIVYDSIVIQGIGDLTDLVDSPPAEEPRKRKIRLPIILFILTCFSTFLAGATKFNPLEFFDKIFSDLTLMDKVFSAEATLLSWAETKEGLLYMAAVLGILLFHEMGHFLQTVRYKIPASLPMFIPIPIHPLGTMGAVIGMDGLRANRKQLFDIGISGPLAGLVLAIPIVCIGIAQLDATANPQLPGDTIFTHPYLVKQLLPLLNKEFAEKYPQGVALRQLNPLYMAGWVGLLITGLNMVPMSQLDGGHVVYTLFGKFGNTIARFTLCFAIGYIIITGKPIWIVMLILVIFIGVDHPPTFDDRVPLGRTRELIGRLSLAIPIVCFPIDGIVLAH